jgi:hypothetical protein
MGNKEKTPIVLDDVEYFYEDMNPQQQGIVNHIEDLSRKISSMAFNLDQLNVGKAAFVRMLKESLEAKPEETTEQ